MILRFIVFLCFFVFLYVGEAKASERIASMTCTDLQAYEPDEKIDIKRFAVEQIDLFKRKYPEFDVSEYKMAVLNHIPSKHHSDDVSPFFWVVVYACRGSIESDETIGVKIEKALYELFYRRKQKAESEAKEGL